MSSSQRFQLDDQIEVRAFLDLFRSVPRSFRQEHKIAALEIGDGCALSYPATRHMSLNRVFGLDDLHQLEEACDWLSRRGGAPFLQIGSRQILASVEGWIKSSNLVSTGADWVKFYIAADDVVSLPDGPVTIRSARANDAHLFCHVMSRAFGLPPELGTLWYGVVGSPPWTCLIAYIDAEPVGTAVMYIEGDNAWLGACATIPAHRNRGVQKALLRGRLKYGLELNVKLFSLETELPEAGRNAGSVSFANVGKVGFAEAYARRNFHLRAS